MQGIPNGMDREQACRVLNLMADEVRMLAEKTQGAETPEFWVSMASIMESYAELYTALPGLTCDEMFQSIGELYLRNGQAVDNDGKGLNQIAKVYSSKPFSNLECAGKVIKKLSDRMHQRDVGHLGGFYVSEIADALSQGPAKEAAPRIKPMMHWMLNTDSQVGNEVRTYYAARIYCTSITCKRQWC